MADHWFLQRSGKRYGPFTFPQFQQMTTTGQLLPVDLVAQAEAGPWLPAAQVPELFASEPDTPFEFSDSETPTRRTKTRPRSTVRNMPPRTALFVGGGVLGVAVLGVALFMLIGYGSKRTAGTEPVTKSSSAGVKSNSRSENRRPGKRYLEDVIAERGPPFGSYAAKHSMMKSADDFLYVWKGKSSGYDIVYTALLTKLPEPEFVQGEVTGVDQQRLDAILFSYRPK
jgi:hypothetical protein